MIYGIGTDIVKIDRIKKLYIKYGDRFIKKILSRREAECLPEKNRYTSIAGRFAAKEAIIKAIGRKAAIGFKDIEIYNYESGKPFIKDTMRIKEVIIDSSNELYIHISISHERDFAIACAVIETLK